MLPCLIKYINFLLLNIIKSITFYFLFLILINLRYLGLLIFIIVYKISDIYIYFYKDKASFFLKKKFKAVLDPSELVVFVSHAQNLGSGSHDPK